MYSPFTSRWAFVCLILAGCVGWTLLVATGREPLLALVLTFVAMLFTATFMDVMSFFWRKP